MMRALCAASILLTHSCGNAEDQVARTPEIYSLWASGDYHITIDIRSRAEWNGGHIEGALFMENLASTGDVSALDDIFSSCANTFLSGLRREDVQIFVYCGSSFRAARAVPILHQAGFTATTRQNSGEGFSTWRNAGFPTDTLAAMPADVFAQTELQCRTTSLSTSNATQIWNPTGHSTRTSTLTSEPETHATATTKQPAIHSSAVHSSSTVRYVNTFTSSVTSKRSTSDASTMTTQLTSPTMQSATDPTTGMSSSTTVMSASSIATTESTSRETVLSSTTPQSSSVKEESTQGDISHIAASITTAESTTSTFVEVQSTKAVPTMQPALSLGCIRRLQLFVGAVALEAIFQR